MSPAEEAAVERLISTRWPLLMDGERVNTKSEDGSKACAAYLEALDAASRVLRLDKAPRSYRDDFTVNYRALFPDESRNYRVDVLEAAFEQYAVIWVNGDKFEFSTEAMRRAETLQRAWWELCASLERWSQASGNPRMLVARPPRSELRNSLVSLDFAWASFEHKYIAELIAIEEKARRLLVQAIEHDNRVHELEMNSPSETLRQIPQYCEEQQCLVKCVSHLNSVANVSRKGRDDLSVDVLFDAVATLRRCDASEQSAGSCEHNRAARILATDVVESFESIRVYLREVEHCLERVDPHLCNNSGLVARLVDWEESWEMGTRYMQNEKLLGAVCDLVAEVRMAQRLVPALTTMCDDCDVELFMVLPRIMWLCFLARPAQYTQLMESILPHLFIEAKEGISQSKSSAVCCCDPKLEAVIDLFGRTKRLVSSMISAEGRDKATAEKDAWDIMVQRVVVGADSQEAYRCVHLSGDRREETRAAVEDLMHQLEPWSIELQRHCPEDWNQCSAVLVQCLTRGTKEQKDVPFRV